jgi:glycosyltransferase involved in cell wall biosynthesis
MSQPPVLSIISPCYNEEEVLHSSIPALQSLLDKLITEEKISDKSYLCIVDDGSTDKSFDIIENLKRQYHGLIAIKFSKNFGHQSAILAGLLNNQADIYITVDVDLQDDLDAVSKMVEHYKNGFHIVYGVKKDRNADGAVKKLSAELYYKFMQLMGVNLVFNHADFRLLSSQAVEKLKEFEEKNLFLRGIIPLLGFPSTKVYYKIKKREAGKSKYNLCKMASLAINGITSFSTIPLKFITLTGFLVFLFSIFYGIYSIIQKVSGDVVQGWTSIILALCFIGGLQLFSLGIIGEYIAKIYTETKRRPLYIIEKTID